MPPHHLARKPTVHVPRATIITPNTALRRCTVPRGPIVRKLHRIAVHALRRHEERDRQCAIDFDALRVFRCQYCLIKGRNVD